MTNIDAPNPSLAVADTVSSESVVADLTARSPAGIEKLPAGMRAHVWKKGQSGNPKGNRKRPKKGDALEAARDFADNAVRELWKMATNPKTPAETRRKALNDLIDRGYGKVSRTLKLEPPPGASGPQPQDMLALEMDAALAGAQQVSPDAPAQPARQEILPPLTVDPFAVPEDLNRPRRPPDAPLTGFARPGGNPKSRDADDLRAESVTLSGDSLRAENAGLGAGGVALSGDSQHEKNLKTAFDMGVAVGQAMGDDDD